MSDAKRGAPKRPEPVPIYYFPKRRAEAPITMPSVPALAPPPKAAAREGAKSTRKKGKKATPGASPRRGSTGRKK